MVVVIIEIPIGKNEFLKEKLFSQDLYNELSFYYYEFTVLTSSSIRKTLLNDILFIITFVP